MSRAPATAHVLSCVAVRLPTYSLAMCSAQIYHETGDERRRYPVGVSTKTSATASRVRQRNHIRLGDGRYVARAIESAVDLERKYFNYQRTMRCHMWKGSKWTHGKHREPEVKAVQASEDSGVVILSG